MAGLHLGETERGRGCRVVGSAGGIRGCGLADWPWLPPPILHGSRARSRNFGLRDVRGSSAVSGQSRTPRAARCAGLFGPFLTAGPAAVAGKERRAETTSRKTFTRAALFFGLRQLLIVGTCSGSGFTDGLASTEARPYLPAVSQRGESDEGGH